MRFRKKPVEVDAIQYQREENIMTVQDFFGDGDGREFIYLPEKNEYAIRTLEGDMVVSNGDWIIRGVKGEYYPCKPDIFVATYEPILQEKLKGVWGNQIKRDVFQRKMFVYCIVLHFFADTGVKKQKSTTAPMNCRLERKRHENGNCQLPTRS